LRRSFTLIELLISVGLLSLIILFLYNSLDTLKRSNSFYELHLKSDEKRHQIFDILYFDLLRSDAESISIKQGHEKDFDILTMRSKNSLYNLERPYVTYVVSRDKDRLLRLESLFNLKLPVGYDFENSVKIDMLLEEVELFKLFQNSKKNAIFVSMKHKELEPILFEMELSTPISKPKTQKNNDIIPAGGTAGQKGATNAPPQTPGASGSGAPQSVGGGGTAPPPIPGFSM